MRTAIQERFDAICRQISSDRKAFERENIQPEFQTITSSSMGFRERSAKLDELWEKRRDLLDKFENEHPLKGERDALFAELQRLKVNK